jgi:hypothetical protein
MYLDLALYTVQHYQFMASSGCATGLSEPLSLQPVGHAASQIMLHHISAYAW